MTHGTSHMSLDTASHMAASNFKRWGSVIIPRVWENQTHFVGRTVPDDKSCHEIKKKIEEMVYRQVVSAWQRGSGKVSLIRWHLRRGLKGEKAIWMGVGATFCRGYSKGKVCLACVRNCTSRWLVWSEQGESSRKSGQRGHRVVGH